MAADVEAIALVLVGRGDAADLRVRFEDDGRTAAPRQHVRGGQPGRTGANDDMLCVQTSKQGAGDPVRMSITRTCGNSAAL